MNQLTIVNPHNDAGIISRTREAIMERQRENEAKINANADAMVAENYRFERLNRFDDLKKWYADRQKELAQIVADDTGATAILIQLKASENIVADAIKKRQDKLRALKSANDLPMPTHTYFYAVTATDADHVKIQKKIADFDPHFGCISPQNDAEWRVADKLFKVDQNGKGNN